MEKNRKIIRKKDHNYSYECSYFITICTKDRAEVFGEIVDNKVKLNELGNVASRFWECIPLHNNMVMVDEFIIMPNHVHGIIHILSISQDEEIERNTVGTNHGLSLQTARMNQRLPNVLKQYKSTVSREINKIPTNSFFEWQRSYFDRIIRDDKSLLKAREYIYNNPLNWERDLLRTVELPARVTNNQK